MFICFISVLASSILDSQSARRSFLHFLSHERYAATSDSVTSVTSSSSVSAGDKMINSIDTTDGREVIITDDSFTIQPFSIPTGRSYYSYS